MSHDTYAAKSVKQLRALRAQAKERSKARVALGFIPDRSEITRIETELGDRVCPLYYDERIREHGLQSGELLHGLLVPKSIRWPSMLAVYFNVRAFLDNGWDTPHTEPPITRDDFGKQCHALMCTAWAKCDRNGEHFGGFWRAPEGSSERENAYHLSWEDNIQCLWELPYPHVMKLALIEPACGRIMDSPASINILCEMLRRKHVDITRLQHLLGWLRPVSRNQSTRQWMRARVGNDVSGIIASFIRDPTKMIFPSPPEAPISGKTR